MKKKLIFVSIIIVTSFFVTLTSSLSLKGQKSSETALFQVLNLAKADGEGTIGEKKFYVPIPKGCSTSTYSMKCPNGSYVTCYVLTCTTTVTCPSGGNSDCTPGTFSTTTTTCQKCP